MARKNNEKPNAIYGECLDGVKLDYLPYDMREDIKAISCYGYEDGKPWHDNTCVMEFVFWHSHEELDGDCHMRILYSFPWGLLEDLARLIGENSARFSYLHMDLSMYPNEDDGYYVNLDDFERYQCHITHKKHFHPDNPELPDD